MPSPFDPNPYPSEATDLFSSGTTAQMFGVEVSDEGCSEHFDRNGANSTATRTLVCAWGHRAAVIQGLLGVGSVQTGADAQGAGAYTYFGPQPYPDAPWLYAETVDVEGVGVLSAGAGMGAYKYARLKVCYKIPDGLETGSLSVDFGGELLTIPQDVPCFKWEDGTEVPSECNPAIAVSTGHFSITIKNLPSIPTDLIKQLSNKTNQDTLFGCPPETIVYNGASSQKKFGTKGDLNYDLTHNFGYRGVPLPGGDLGGWNHFLRPNGGGFQRVLRIDNNQPPFPTDDLSQLLSPTPAGG